MDMDKMNIYSFIRSRDVAEYCQSIGKTWNPVDMAVIIGRSNRRSLADKHAAWRELITDYPDMEIPGICREGPSYGSLHERLAELINYEERVLELFKTPEANTFYKSEISSDKLPHDDDDIFTDYETALSNLLDKLKDMREQKRNETFEIVMSKVYFGNEYKSKDYPTCKYRISIYFDLDGNVKNVFSNLQKDRFSDTDFSNMLDFSDCGYLGKGFDVEIPTPFKRGDIVIDVQHPSKVFVIERLGERTYFHLFTFSLMFADGLGYSISGNQNYREKLLVATRFCNNDRLEYYRGELYGINCLLKYISMFIKDEINLFALLTLYRRIALKRELDAYSSPRDLGLDLPKEVIDREYSRKRTKITINNTPVNRPSFGTFWVISEDADLEDYKLLCFSVPCDANGNAIEPPAIPMHANEIKYNYRAVWDRHVKNSQLHTPYSAKDFNYYPRGRVEISNNSAAIHINPAINKACILADIETAFGLDSDGISSVKIVDEKTRFYRCFIDGLQLTKPIMDDPTVHWIDKEIN